MLERPSRQGRNRGSEATIQKTWPEPNRVPRVSWLAKLLPSVVTRSQGQQKESGSTPERIFIKRLRTLSKLNGVAVIIVTKQRNGPTGKVKLTFLKDSTRFEDAADEQYDNADE
jgi:replicative DNA helicase